MMNFRYLEVFYHVANELSFSRAAKHLNISPSAITRQVQLFEHSVGQLLFIRDPRSVQLTAEGRDLFHRVKTFIEGSRSVDEKKISFGCLQSILEGQIHQLFEQDKKFWTNVLSEVYIGTPKTLEEKLRQGTLDIIVTNKRTKSGPFKTFKWSEETYKIVSRQNISYKYINNEIIQNKDQPIQKWIITPTLEKLTTKLKIKEENSIKVNSFNASIQMVQNGHGASIIPTKIKLERGVFETPLPENKFKESVYVSFCDNPYQNETLDMAIKKIKNFNP